jgi:hypothetical protein
LGGFIHAWERRGDFWELGDRVRTVGIYSDTGAEGFWARRARTSVDVLGPGVLVGRVANGFGVFFLSWFKLTGLEGSSGRFKLLQIIASETGI